MLSGVHVFCFAASYTVSLALEVSRLFFRARVRWLLIIGFALAGVFAHTLFLVAESQRDTTAGAPLATWYHWLLGAAWVLAITYVALAARRPQAAIGLFMLPLVLTLIGVASSLAAWQDKAPFPRDQAPRIWGMAHGFFLLAGAVVIAFGFVAGLMYLAQSWRLKHKLPPRPGFQLPSLEWLQNVNEVALVVSSCLLLGGLATGVALNLISQTDDAPSVPWTDPVVLTSGMLLVWLVAALLFTTFYKPARQGRKVAYLTVVSFVLLGLELGVVILAPSEHPASPVGRRERVSAAPAADAPTLACFAHYDQGGGA